MIWVTVKLYGIKNYCYVIATSFFVSYCYVLRVVLVIIMHCSAYNNYITSEK